MAKINLILQGKGGVGKSFIAAVLAQYKKSKGQNPLCIDTDPVNTTFACYKTLGVTRLQIIDEDEINPRYFDNLIEWIAKTTEDVIIDNGASSFVPLSHYLLCNKIPELMQDLGHEIVIHTVITGGQALHDTVNGFAQLANQFKDNVSFITWLNPYWGSIVHEGKDFEQIKAYKDNKDKIAAIVRIPTLKEETFGYDLTAMLQERLTFDEAIGSPSKSIMARQRLKIVKDQLFSQLDNAMVI